MHYFISVYLSDIIVVIVLFRYKLTGVHLYIQYSQGLY